MLTRMTLNETVSLFVSVKAYALVWYVLCSSFPSSPKTVDSARLLICISVHGGRFPPPC